MVNLRLRRAGLPIAVSAVVAAVAVTGTIFAISNAGAETVTTTDTVAAARAAITDAKKLAPKRTTSGTSASGKRSLAAASDEVNFGDVTGDGRADLTAIDSGGIMWVYPGKRYVYPGTGTRSKNIFGTRIRVGEGWGKFNSLVRHGDFNGDGRQDIMTRDVKGNLALYAGTGNASKPFKNGTAAGTGWGNFTSITGAGDLNSDGRDDLLGQKTNGDLALYTGTGSSSKPFSTRGTKVGNGWKGDLLTAAGDLSGDGRTEFWFRNTKGELTLYDSQSGANPIGKGTKLFDADFGRDLKNMVAPGDLTSDSGNEPQPDTLFQFKDGMLMVLAFDTGAKADPVLGTGWASYRLF